MKDRPNIQNLIVRNLNGNCTKEEQQELLRWIEESQENKKEYFSVKDIWDSTRKHGENTEEQLALFYRTQLAKTKSAKQIWIRYSAAVAAILVIGMIISLVFNLNITGFDRNYHVFTVPLGSRSKVVLADGSVVNLNSGSELKYSTDFSSRKRIVYLTGEAFFQVKSDQSHPFIVKTSDFEVKATGTRFNVCSYSEDVFSNTTLEEGKISVNINHTNQIFEVKQGEKFKLNRSNRKYVLDKADIESEVAWKDGDFIFKNIPFPELAMRLERWYNVKLNYSDEGIRNFAYTGRFKNQETIWQVFDALKLTSPIDYRKTNFREFTINYKPMN